MPTLTLEVPDAVYERLSANAERRGSSVEEVVRDALATIADDASDTQLTREEVLNRLRHRASEMPPTSAEQFDQWRRLGRP